jgi:hypothetical protein
MSRLVVNESYVYLFCGSGLNCATDSERGWDESRPCEHAPILSREIDRGDGV